LASQHCSSLQHSQFKYSNLIAEAKQSATATQVTAQTFEFARLQFEDEDSVTWLIGGNARVRTESVRATYRRLGGRGTFPGSFSDLLNQIGSEGWNLTEKDGDVWIFSRPTS
jgi:hypothetical protein